jgi:Mn-dependent DtxR family transcriptional regulator
MTNKLDLSDNQIFNLLRKVEKSHLKILKTLHEEDGWIYSTHEEISKKLNITISSTTRFIAKLNKFGWLIKEQYFHYKTRKRIPENVLEFLNSKFSGRS